MSKADIPYPVKTPDDWERFLKDGRPGIGRKKETSPKKDNQNDKKTKPVRNKT